jgi:hypothetical protein
MKLYTTLGLALAALIFPMLTMPYKAMVATASTTPSRVVVDTKTIIFQDVHGNKKPAPGDLTEVQGRLFTPRTTTQVGIYRCTFPFEGWVNSTEGTPVTLATQVFDIKGKGMIVLVGDEPSVEAVGKPASGVIAGGTGEFFAIRGTGTLTAEAMQGTQIPVKVAFDIVNATGPVA